jgi:heme exporter protein C
MNSLSLDAARQTVRRGRVLTFIALALVIACGVRAVEFTPVERFQGLAQKIFYLHVPAAWSAFLAFGLVGIVSALFLWLGDRRLDLFAESSAEVGTVLTAIVLITGPIWGKPIWGAWWVWGDARLTSTLFLFFLFVGYQSLRSSVHDVQERARLSAVLGICGAVLIPFIHLTVYLFRTQHPMPVVAKPEGPTLPSVMLVTLLSSFGAFTLLYLGFVTTRYGIAQVREVREAADAG